MAAWDLYVDESGSFDIISTDDKYEYNLVGGYLIPHSEMSPQIADDWYKGLEKGFRKKYGDVHFDLKHAKENQRDSSHSSADIMKMQMAVLDWYHRQINRAGGYIVTFEVPRAEVSDFVESTLEDTGIDKNTKNYLTIISRGIIHLYNELVSRINENAPEVYLYIAQRKDVTRGYGTIPLDQYKEMITKIVDAYAHWLKEDEFFHTIMEKENHFQIIPDGQDPRIIPCDWICNTYWRAEDPHTYGRVLTSPRFVGIYKRIYVDNPKRIQFVTTQMSALSEPYFNEMVRNRNYVQILFRLLQDGFDRNPNTEKFFERINQVDIIDQRLFSRHVPEHYDLFVRNYTKLSMNKAQAVEKELYAILSILTKDDGTDRLKNAEISNLLKARVLVHLFHIHIHQGKGGETWQKANEIAVVLNNLPDSEDKAEIKLRFFNREIVALTDSFDYERAKEVFHTLDQYWSAHLPAQRKLLALSTGRTDYVKSESSSTDNKAMASEWGEEIGSYIQVYSHNLPMVDEARRIELYNEIKSRFKAYLESFSDVGQWGRSYQNLCDLEAEMGHYDIAFAYLVRDVYGTSPFEKKVPIESDSIDDGEKINLKNCGKIVNETKSSEREWDFEHYLRLGAEIAYAHLYDPEDRKNKSGKILFQAMHDHIGSNDEIVEVLNAIEYNYLRTISLRNFARMTAAFDAGRGTDSYYEKASSTISFSIDESMVFRMIYVSILLERAAHLLRIGEQTPTSEIVEKAQQQMKEVHQAYRDKIVKGVDPFLPEVDDLVETVKKELKGKKYEKDVESKFKTWARDLMNAAKRIPY